MRIGRKLGCNTRPSTIAEHAKVAMSPVQLLPAWSRIVGTPRILGGNDRIGDCAIVAGFNAIQTKLARQNNYTALPEDLPPKIYGEITGYNPANPATDQGTDPEAFFAWWQENAICGHKLSAFTRLNPRDSRGIRNSIASLGIYLCVSLPVELEMADEWRAIGMPGSWGGHAVWADGYEADETNATSWGQNIPIEQSFFTDGFVGAAFSLEIVSI